MATLGSSPERAAGGDAEMARNAQDWAQRPKPCPSLTTWTPRLYTDPGLFDEERAKIFDRTWIIACHESELPAAYDYRTFPPPGREEPSPWCAATTARFVSFTA